MPENAYRLKVTLKGIKPPVWRRLVVPKAITLARLHEVLQVSVGWLNAHLHEFEIGDDRYGEPDEDDWGPMSAEPVRSERARLSDLVGPGDRFLYRYDFGDDWRHEILVEAEVAAAPGQRHAVCVAGRRTAPPEDCGGPFAYDGFLEAIRDPKHPEHTAMRDWIGYDFDPEAFNANEISAALAILWP